MSVTAELRKLRTRAKMTMGEVAVAIGLAGPSSYQRYESEELFRDEHLPLDLTRKLAAVFAERGIPAVETMELAGIAEHTEPDIGIDLVKTVVEALAAYLAEERLTMSPPDQADTVGKLLTWYVAERAKGHQPASLSVQQASAYIRLLDQGRRMRGA